MKKNSVVLLGLLLSISFFISCTAKLDTGVPEQQKDEILVMTIEEAKASIQAVVDSQVEAINHKDGSAYLTTINPDNATYYNEATYLANKLGTANYSDYSLVIEDVVEITPGSYKASLTQKYKQNVLYNKVTYDAHFIKSGNTWYDDDVIFEIKEVDGVVVRYMPEVAEVDVFIENVKSSIDIVNNTFPESVEGPVEIKLYSDQELLRQKTDFGIEWLFTGWAEEGHAIKAYTGHGTEYDYVALFTHELVHKLTIKVSKGNMPVWLAEGLAIHYGTNQVNKGDYIQAGRSSAEAMRMDLVTLSQLNLETLSSRDEIMGYYGAAGMVVYYMVERFGNEKVYALYQGLGTYPLSSMGSDSNWWQLSNERTEETIQSVLGLGIKILSDDYFTWYNERYPVQ